MCFDDVRRRNLFAAPRDILRISPGDLLAAMASLMALWNLGGRGSMVESGNCRGVGEKSEGMFRPRGPSGDDCNESAAGLAVDEVSFGVAAEAGVNGIVVLMYCLNVGCKDGVGDGQHLLPFVMLGDEVIEAGSIILSLWVSIYWIASGWGSRVFVSFRMVSECGV